MSNLQKHAGGRPTKYNPNFIGEIEEYLLTVGRENTKLPKRVDIALLLGVDEDTLNNWAEVHPEFFGALSRVDLLQKSQLMDDGMYGGKEVNAHIAKFLLSANHGLVEKQQTMMTGADGNAIQLQVIANAGYLPPDTRIIATPDRGDAELATEIQSLSLAPESEKDHNGGDGDGQTGSS